jgi:hypothetical protein
LNEAFLLLIFGLPFNFWLLYFEWLNVCKSKMRSDCTIIGN